MTAPFSGFVGSTTVELGVAPERGYEPSVAPAITWERLASNIWRGTDDGYYFDAHSCNLSYIVSQSAMSAFEAFVESAAGSRVTMYVPAGVYPFGPHIDPSSGLPVKIQSWKPGSRIAPRTDAVWLHVGVTYDDRFSPAYVAPPTLLSRKFATASTAQGFTTHPTEAGLVASVARGRAAYTTTIVLDALTNATAAPVVAWFLYQRTAPFTFTPSAGQFPFGPLLGNGPFTCRLTGFKLSKPRHNRWDITVTLSRDY